MQRAIWIDDEMAMLQDNVARFAARELVPHLDRWERDKQIDVASRLKAGEAGLLGAGIPEEYGGSGGGLAHEAVIQRELALAGLGGSFGAFHSVHSAIVAHYVTAYGTPQQKRRWLPGLASGALVGAIGMTEPGTGSDLKAIRTTARSTADGYRIDGQKTFISNGQNAGLVLVVARTGEQGGRGISLVAVETDGAQGFRRGRNLEKIGMHAQDTSELFFDDLLVPAGNLLGGEPGQGFTQLMQQLGWERMVIAIGAAANMEYAVRLTVDYVRERKAFGSALLDFQNTQFVLADAKTHAMIGRTLVDALMVSLLAGELDDSTAAMAKLWTTDTAFKVIDACQQLFGGYGYMREYPIARLFADSRVSRVYGGSNEIMKLIVARTL